MFMVKIPSKDSTTISHSIRASETVLLDFCVRRKRRESHKHEVERIIFFSYVFGGKVSEAEIRSIARLRSTIYKEKSSLWSKLYGKKRRKYAGILFYPLNINNFYTL